MTNRWVVLSDGARPTEDIYFLESAAPSLRSSGGVVSRLATRRWRVPLALSAALALRRLAGANLIICRALAPAWLRLLERHREVVGRICYLVDDDIPAAMDEATLPASYRARMARVARLQPRLLALADEVVVSSEALAARFAGRHPRVSVLTPPLLAPLPALTHFDHRPDAAAPWWVGYHGTRAHLPDLSRVAPALVDLHDATDSVGFEVMLGQHTPAELGALARCTAPSPLPWSRFREYQRQRRIHIGLAPLLDTPFNRGKSFIKFLDIAAMGGVGIYSRRLPYTEIVEDGVNGLLADDSPEDWYRCLTRLLDHPQEAGRMAQAAADTARRVGEAGGAVEFWRAR
ncbi:glycosyltransferase family protein [Halomonas stenophila]|uniref:Glycosyltransferase involved in cell wall biosynthesis n=1 Tax=Halomonas stenophila TaxID=795312 RepID=A0A7W5ESZ6_9GAMM|nr:glycosyltransferase [Halomonas stenophila]MBB3230175.1 glycosyltransferase involved in cell wall biosynthesis [Halomonas stenophila]